MSQQATRPTRPVNRRPQGQQSKQGQQMRRAPQRKPGQQRKRATGPKPAPKYPLWVRWVALVLFVAVLGFTFVQLGEWQLRRLHQRRASNEVVRVNEKVAIADFSQIFDRQIGPADEWKRVRVTGTFDATHQFIIRYRDNGNDSGYEVVAPLRTSTGKTVLIDRGFVALSDSQQIPNAAPPVPTGTVTIVGRVRPDETGSDSATVPVNGQARLVNSVKMAAALHYPVVNGYIDVLTMSPKDTRSFQRIDLPELDDGPHFWYAVQWFMFTGIGVLGIFVFIHGDLRDRRERREAEEQEAAEKVPAAKKAAAKKVAAGKAPTATDAAGKDITEKDAGEDTERAQDQAGVVPTDKS